jgi:regulator of sirC expression with transglutaminase-like and TPR domain
MRELDLGATLSAMTANDARVRFVALLDRDDAAIDLAQACFLISAEANSALDIASCNDKLQRIANAVSPRILALPSAEEKAALLARYLFDEAEFRGNRSDFYDPRNSYLDCVLDRRTGIPITLSILWISVAQRLEIPAYGVGFPGHFLVGIPGATPAGTPLYVDPFSGTLLTPDDCRERLRDMSGGDLRFEPGMLEPASHRQILARVLRNLKQIHIHAKDFGQAIACIDRILILQPDQPTELRDRGLMHRELECWTSAREDLERAIALAPHAPEVSEVRGVLEELQVRTAHIH